MDPPRVPEAGDEDGALGLLDQLVARLAARLEAQVHGRAGLNGIRRQGVTGVALTGPVRGLRVIDNGRRDAAVDERDPLRWLPFEVERARQPPRIEGVV